MFKSLISWILSKLFPLRNGTSILVSKDATFNGRSGDWTMAKIRESELFYGGQDGTTWRDER
jgi:hypothetical protein